MKKIFNLFIVIIISLFININHSYALSGNSVFKCNSDKVSYGNNVECSLYMNVSSGGLTAYEGVINLGSAFTITDYSIGSKWQGDMVGSKVGVYTNNPLSGNVLIMTFKIKAIGMVGSTNTISISSIKVSDEENNTIKNQSDLSFSLKIPNNDNTLKSLNVSGYNLNETFSSSTTNYSLNVDTDKITVTATANSSSSSVSGIGTISLNYGSNTINIKVTAEDGSSKTYTINVTRKDTRNTDNTLKSLSLSSGKINFKSNTTDYIIEVESNIDKISLVGVTNDSKASIKYEPGSTVSLEKGVSKTIKVIVTAENQTTKTYTLKVTRKDDRNTDNTLKSLNVGDYNINFKSNVLEYAFEVNNDVTHLDINAITNNNKATVKVNNIDPLVEGENIITIEVTAENQTKKTYTLKVTRVSASEEAKEEVVTSDEEEEIKTDTTNNTDTSYCGHNDLLYKLLIIINPLLIIAVIVLIILFIKEKRK